MRVETLADGVVLYNADCREVLPTLGRFDAVVTDPPYGIGESNKNFASRGKLASADKYDRSNWDDKPADGSVIEWCLSHSDRQIIWGGNYFGLPATSCYLVWDKLGPANDFADCELAWTNLRRAVRRIRYLWNGCMRMEKDVERQHPTQKPIEVMRWCFGFIPECKTVIDPYLGSGTTGVAAVKLGRNFTGIEIDERYFDIACRRISEALKQPDLFIEPPKPSKQEALL